MAPFFKKWYFMVFLLQILRFKLYCIEGKELFISLPESINIVLYKPYPYSADERNASQRRLIIEQMPVPKKMTESGDN
ncbi:hypothetical protein [Segetibacter koreensis]|uniref:hypothetical protein n=1 Tax=Segetibacter koreensis TaxID=398037 RepID=UPI0003659A7E|nr:hypothetical protein [Segetibacter koreensis]